MRWPPLARPHAAQALGQLLGGIGVGHVVAQLRAVALLNLCRLVLQCIAAACLYVLNMSISA